MSKAITTAMTQSVKLTDAQLAMLSLAAKREDRCLAPPPSMRGAQIARLGEKLIAAGYVREVKARASVPIWRRDSETGAALALRLTSAGLKAAATANVPPFKEKPAGGVEKLATSEAAVPSLPNAIKPVVDLQPAKEVRSQGEPRASSKIAAVIGLLSRAEGATLAELVAATSWLPHTTRAALSGLRKRGRLLTLDRSDRQRGSVYRIDPAAGRRVETEAGGRAAEVA